MVTYVQSASPTDSPSWTSLVKCNLLWTKISHELGTTRCLYSVWTWIIYWWHRLHRSYHEPGSLWSCKMFLILCYKHPIFHQVLTSILGMKRLCTVRVSCSCVVWVTATARPSLAITRPTRWLDHIQGLDPCSIYCYSFHRIRRVTWRRPTQHWGTVQNL